MNVQVEARRRAAAYVPSLFAPIGLILLLPLLCVWVRTDVHERVNWVITAAFALIALNFSVAVEYPALGVDSTFMRLFWYGYAVQGITLGIILLLYNEGAVVDRLGEDVVEETLSFLRWAFPALLVVAVADVVLSIAV
jgi:hypothetical protein